MVHIPLNYVIVRYIFLIWVISFRFWIMLCRDTIFHDLRITLGSYVKGPDNVICREWVWKDLPLGARQRSGPGFMRAPTKVCLDCIVEPYIDVV